MPLLRGIDCRGRCSHHRLAAAVSRPSGDFALDRNVHVLVEVPAAVSMAQAESLLAAARTSSAMYMLAENYCYTRPNVVVDAMVRRGLFGHVYYGESEYLHEMHSYYTTATGEHTWRYYWHAGRDGHPYPTHNLGPCWTGSTTTSRPSVASGAATIPNRDTRFRTSPCCFAARHAARF